MEELGLAEVEHNARNNRMRGYLRMDLKKKHILSSKILCKQKIDR